MDIQVILTLAQVDHSRVNEYGYSGEMLEEKEKAAIENGGAAATPATHENEKRAVADKETEKTAEEKKTD